jgi:phosphatidylglycerol:prolipoprotein diacylglycerol transferase
MNPILVSFGSFEIRYYSVFILIAAIIMFTMVELEAKRFEIPQQFTFNMLFWTLIFGFVGARLYYVLFNFSLFRTDLMEIIRVWNGGLAIHGGIIFGLITLILYCKKYKVRPVRMMDMIVVPLIIGQAIGRWGNFFNSEAHGAATTVEKLKTLFIPDFIIKGMTIDGVVYSPTFLYESFFCLIGFIILLFVRRGKYTKVGTITAIYMVWYGVLRFFIEISRTDSLMIGNIKMAQVVSIVMVVIGVGMLMYRTARGKFEDLYNDKENIPEIKF